MLGCAYVGPGRLLEWLVLNYAFRDPEIEMLH